MASGARGTRYSNMMKACSVIEITRPLRGHETEILLEIEQGDIMEKFNGAMETMNGIVWGIPMMVLLLGVGAFLTVGLRFISLTKIGYGFRQLFKKRSGEAEEGDVSPFAALMTALSSTVGTGNIAGVAAAIAIGGPG